MFCTSFGHTEGGSFKARLELCIFFEMFEFNIISFEVFGQFWWFWWSGRGFLKSEWYRNHSKICPGERILKIWDATICATTFFACKRLFLSLGRSVARSLCRSVARSLGRRVARSLVRSVARSLDRSLDRWLARSIRISLVPSLDRLDGVARQKLHPL